MNVVYATAPEITAAIAQGKATASATIETTLARIEALNPTLNAFTAITPDRARAKAKDIDYARSAGKALGPLAGVPFAVKNLFDVAGLTTLAGSKINRQLSPAKSDSPLIARLEEAGAILVGALNMGEYAYDFTGENIHDGPSRNPHDLTRMTGGSSGGSGGAVAGGLVPFALGSDTNGSIRVPASFCGIFGLKPTYGRLTRSGTFPFVASFDHLGPLARSVRDLALSYDAMQGPDETDHAQAKRPIAPCVDQLGGGIAGLRIAVAGGYFQEGAEDAPLAALRKVAAALGADRTLEIPEVARARAAAFVITAAEGSALHLKRLRQQADDFDPAVRDRLIAGAMIPSGAIIAAQKLRRWYQARLRELFATTDILLTPATPCTAPLLGETQLNLGGKIVPLRPNIGVYTQPFSFAGLPAVVVPVPLHPMPAGVQIVAAPWHEDLILRVAHYLETTGIVAATPPKGL